ncbi:hypothetical protein [Thalassoglobus polymorphus]|uniref:Uncharacterized protein n=1 Tax=Thalassoglobus polymorphus TaxID=2527994 RepID=A0A517QKN2_9PLAN|nr:hypothetical protein [Thalassoglobus polymorphus]QDT32202.1 hypothetical protein Mal48_14440 [Thalassoglobus polymorphus]
MATYTVYTLIYLLILGVTWIGPRLFGLLGMFASHILTVFIWSTCSVALAEFGLGVEYEGIFTFIELLIQSFLINLLLCPVAIHAMFRWRRLSPISPLFDHEKQVH